MTAVEISRVGTGAGAAFRPANKRWRSELFYCAWMAMEVSRVGTGAGATLGPADYDWSSELSDQLVS
jgi:hypothetical protein